jgi:hypothetical protein
LSAAYARNSSANSPQAPIFFLRCRRAKRLGRPAAGAKIFLALPTREKACPARRRRENFFAQSTCEAAHPARRRRGKFFSAADTRNIFFADVRSASSRPSQAPKNFSHCARAKSMSVFGVAKSKDTHIDFVLFGQSHVSRQRIVSAL